MIKLLTSDRQTVNYQSQFSVEVHYFNSNASLKNTEKVLFFFLFVCFLFSIKFFLPSRQRVLGRTLNPKNATLMPRQFERIFFSNLISTRFWLYDRV